MFIDSKLNFDEHLKIIFQKPNKTIGLLHKLQTLLPLTQTSFNNNLLIVYQAPVGLWSYDI